MIAALLKSFSEAFKRVSPDFQTLHGYGRTPPGRANLKIAGSQIAERFKWVHMLSGMLLIWSSQMCRMPCTWNV